MKLTEQQLNEKIAELRGDIKCGELYIDGKIAERVEDGVVPNYTSDMNPATALLRELEYPSLEPCRHAKTWRIYFDSKGYRLCRENSAPAVLICLAWLQWKTGEAVEVES